MTTTLTWSFINNFQFFEFTDASTGSNSVASRSHVISAIRNTLFLANEPNVSCIARNEKQLRVLSATGDSVEVDHGATSDALDSQIKIVVFFTDDTQEDSTNSIFNGAAIKTYTIVANGKTIERIRVQTARSTGVGGVGSTHTHDILEVRLITAAVPTATAGLLQLAPLSGAGGKNASIDADGTNLYVAAFNDLGFPTLVKIATTLAADGSVIFNPLAGDNIGVESSRFEVDTLWVVGQFDSTNVIEKSDDAGSNFTVIDNGMMGNIRSFIVGKDNENRILVFDQDNGDILETTDNGVTWTTINASVTPEINVIDRLDRNLEETVFGNDGGVNNSINYTVNSGVNLEDFQTGIYPNANATGIIVN